MRRISWISSTVLAAPGASFTGGVLSVIIRPKQLEDYTVTHNVETDVWRRALLPARRTPLGRFFRLRRKLTPYHTARLITLRTRKRSNAQQEIGTREERERSIQRMARPPALF